MSDSEEELLSAFNSLGFASTFTDTTNTMDPATLERIVQSAVSGAIAAQSAVFEKKIVELNEKLNRATAVVRAILQISNATTEFYSGIFKSWQPK